MPEIIFCKSQSQFNEPRDTGLFYVRSKRASHARLMNTEPFRMTLEDAGLVIGAFLWAGILCDKVHH